MFGFWFPVSAPWSPATSAQRVQLPWVGWSARLPEKAVPSSSTVPSLLVHGHALRQPGRGRVRRAELHAGRVVGEQVTKELRELDEVAYVRFASVYRSFKDLAEFRAEIDKLSKDTP